MPGGGNKQLGMILALVWTRCSGKEGCVCTCWDVAQFGALYRSLQAATRLRLCYAQGFARESRRVAECRPLQVAAWKVEWLCDGKA